MATNSLENKVVLGLHLDAGASDGYLVSAVNVKDETGNQTVQAALDAIDGKIGGIDLSPYVKKEVLVSNTGSSMVGVAEVTSGSIALGDDTLDGVMQDIADYLNTHATNISSVSAKATANATAINTINTTLAKKADASATVSDVTLNAKTLSVTVGGTTKTFTTQDTTYSDATTSAAGLMSAADKEKLDKYKNEKYWSAIEASYTDGTSKSTSTVTAGSNGDTLTVEGADGITVTAGGTEADFAIGLKAASKDNAGSMSASDFVKLSGIAAGAQANYKGWNALSASYTKYTVSATDGTNTSATKSSTGSATSTSGSTLALASDNYITVEVANDKITLGAQIAEKGDIDALFSSDSSTTA